jgi:hypothetical protein
VIDHTLSWEIARVGGMIAYLLVVASVLVGMLVSLKLRSPRWPRFVTTELHRYLTVLALAFVVIHGLAVWLDAFTGFTPAEVLVPFASHYRRLWVALGIVAGYLLLAVWASEYVRGRIGYAWWRRLHFGAFGVFALATVHGIATGTDTASPWGLAAYAVSVGAVLVLLVWRLLAGGGTIARAAAVVASTAVVGWLVVFTLTGPALAGWNEIANDGHGSGASLAWLAAHPAAASAPAARIDTDLAVTLVGDDRLVGRFIGASSGSVALQVADEEEPAQLSLSLSNGWACSGAVGGSGTVITSVCQAGDGSTVDVEVSSLRRMSNGGIVGHLAVEPATPNG